MRDQRTVRVSKFLSLVLRHQPELIGASLDREGWMDIDALIAGAATHVRALDVALIRTVVEANDKQRFAISDDGRRIRAVQGHSVDSVAIQRERKFPPAVLYHGTATRFLDAILAEGLRPGTRHHVHLSEEVATATSVGSRYGTAVVLMVDAATMHELGHEFFQAHNHVWLTARVPPRFLTPA